MLSSENCVLCLDGGGDGTFLRVIKEDNVTANFDSKQHVKADLSQNIFYLHPPDSITFYFVNNSTDVALVGERIKQNCHSDQYFESVKQN